MSTARDQRLYREEERGVKDRETEILQRENLRSKRKMEHPLGRFMKPSIIYIDLSDSTYNCKIHLRKISKK